MIIFVSFFSATKTFYLIRNVDFSYICCTYICLCSNILCPWYYSRFRFKLSQYSWFLVEIHLKNTFKINSFVPNSCFMWPITLCMYVVLLTQRFTNEDHLAVHKHKHEMTLRFGPARSDSVIIAGEYVKNLHPSSEVISVKVIVVRLIDGSLQIKHRHPRAFWRTARRSDCLTSSLVPLSMTSKRQPRRILKRYINITFSLNRDSVVTSVTLFPPSFTGILRWYSYIRGTFHHQPLAFLQLISNLRAIQDSFSN